MNAVALVAAFASSMVAGAGLWLALSRIQDGMGAAARHRWSGMAFWSTAVLPIVLLSASRPLRSPLSALTWNAIDTFVPRLPDALPAQYWVVTAADVMAIAALLAGLVGSLRLAVRWRATCRIERVLRPSNGGRLPIVTVPIASPVLMGYRRPMILLPESIQAYPPSVIDALVRHEGAHARRHDNWRLLAESWAMALLPWCWPLRRLHRLLLAAREELCDAIALEGVDDATRAGYARALLDALRRTTSPIMGSTMAGPLPALRRRVEAILDPASRQRHPSWQGRLVGMVVFGAGCIAVAAIWAVGEGAQTVAGLHGMTLRFRPTGSNAADAYRVTTLGDPAMPSGRSFQPGAYRVTFRRMHDGTWRISTAAID